MKKIIEWHENLTPSKKIVIHIIGAILLGSIGSGVWEKILAPLFDFILHFSIIFIGKFSSNFIDNLYRSAASGLYDRASLLILFSMAIIFYLGFLYISILKNIKQDKEKEKWLIRIPLLIMAVMLMYQYTKIEAVKIIATSTLNSIEIVRPYVDNKNYYKLRSEFFQMKSVADYERLYIKLEKIDKDFEEIEIGSKQSF